MWIFIPFSINIHYNLIKNDRFLEGRLSNNFYMRCLEVKKGLSLYQLHVLLENIGYILPYSFWHTIHHI